jgi:hypothetical protein
MIKLKTTTTMQFSEARVANVLISANSVQHQQGGVFAVRFH